jgi:hypothetical protein
MRQEKFDVKLACNLSNESTISSRGTKRIAKKKEKGVIV